MRKVYVSDVSEKHAIEMGRVRIYIKPHYGGHLCVASGEEGLYPDGDYKTSAWRFVVDAPVDKGALVYVSDISEERALENRKIRTYLRPFAGKHQCVTEIDIASYHAGGEYNVDSWDHVVQVSDSATATATATAPAPAPFCYACCMKHLCAALVLSTEVPNHPEDERWLIGNLVEAERHCGDVSLRNLIRAYRHGDGSIHNLIDRLEALNEGFNESTTPIEPTD